MKTICKHNKPADLCGLCNPPMHGRPSVLTTGSARFPLQAYELRSSKPKTIPWKFAVVAYEEYAARYGKQQSLERLAERGGFGAEEIIMLLCQHIDRIKGQNDKALPEGGANQTKNHE